MSQVDSLRDCPLYCSSLYSCICHEPEQDFVTIGNSSKTLRFSLAKITNTTQENFYLRELNSLLELFGFLIKVCVEFDGIKT